MKNIGLVCVTHDPKGTNIELIKKHSNILNEIYADIYIAISDLTEIQIINELSNKCFHIKCIPKKGAAFARREALSLALSGTNNHYHYCDFDRLLTWLDKNENELKEILEDIPNCEYLILGRTEKAMNSHPIEWIETEKISNKIFSLELGQEVDVTAGSCSFSRESAQLIIEHSKDQMTDAEWPMIVKRIGEKEIKYKAVEGLEYRDEINRSTRQLGESDDWFSRLRLCYIISESAMKTGKEGSTKSL